ncbi:MAG: propanediol utilization protein [Firmicutes bacterium HGW-Firmicutes-4]|jgi:propanediol utilization protein|nr:MAG: propanediol utilization protein [Firmicutes bacterium HGW-Firmicutes-4]
MTDQIEKIVDIIFEKIYARFKRSGYIEIEASGRHVHLSREVIDKLFGEDYQLTNIKALSQPGQFVSKERVSLIGPKGQLHNVVVLGPEREKSQIEVSQTDAKILGIKVPVKESGKIQGTPPVEISANGKIVNLNEGLLVAERHIHMSTADAKDLSLRDGERVDVEVNTDRPMVFKDVNLRVSDNFDTYMHIDYDEANACNLTEKTLGLIVKK